MKKLIFLCLIFASLIGRAQVTPIMSARIPSLTTAFGQNLPKGTEVCIPSDSIKMTAKQSVASSATLTTAASSFFPTITRVKGVLPIVITGANGKLQATINAATTTAAGSMSAPDKIRVDSIPLLERKINKVTSISSGSTNTQYPSAKVVWDLSATKVDKEAGKHLPDNNYTDSDSIKMAGLANMAVQALSGTTPTWNATSGTNATLPLSGNTTITLSNLVAGMSGNIRVRTHSSVTYTIDLSGYTDNISPAISVPSYAHRLKSSGAGSKDDIYSWWYDGTCLNWNGTLGYIHP